MKKKGGILIISIKVHIQENCEHHTGTQCLSMVNDQIKGFFFPNGLTILLLRMCTLCFPRNQPIISKREQMLNLSLNLVSAGQSNGEIFPYPKTKMMQKSPLPPVRTYCRNDREVPSPCFLLFELSEVNRRASSS